MSRLQRFFLHWRQTLSKNIWKHSLASNVSPERPAKLLKILVDWFKISASKNNASTKPCEIWNAIFPIISTFLELKEEVEIFSCQFQWRSDGTLCPGLEEKIFLRLRQLQKMLSSKVRNRNKSVGPNKWPW